MNIERLIVPIIGVLKCEKVNHTIGAFRACHTWPPADIPDFAETITRLEANICILDTVARTDSLIVVQLSTPIIDLRDERVLQHYQQKMAAAAPESRDATPQPTEQQVSDPLAVLCELSAKDLLPKYDALNVKDKDEESQQVYRDMIK